MQEPIHVASNTQLFILSLAHLPETFLKSRGKIVKYGKKLALPKFLKHPLWRGLARTALSPNEGLKPSGDKRSSSLRAFLDKIWFRRLLADERCDRMKSRDISSSET